MVNQPLVEEYLRAKRSGNNGMASHVYRMMSHEDRIEVAARDIADSKSDADIVAQFEQGKRSRMVPGVRKQGGFGEQDLSGGFESLPGTEINMQLRTPPIGGGPMGALASALAGVGLRNADQAPDIGRLDQLIEGQRAINRGENPYHTVLRGKSGPNGEFIPNEPAGFNDLVYRGTIGPNGEFVPNEPGRAELLSELDQRLARGRSPNPIPRGLRGPDDLGGRMARLQELDPIEKATVAGLDPDIVAAAKKAQQLIGGSGDENITLQQGKWGDPSATLKGPNGTLTYRDLIKGTRDVVAANQQIEDPLDHIRLPAIQGGPRESWKGAKGQVFPLKEDAVASTQEQLKANRALRKDRHEGFAKQRADRFRREQEGLLPELLDRIAEGGQIDPMIAGLIGGKEAAAVAAEHAKNQGMIGVERDKMANERALANDPILIATRLAESMPGVQFDKIVDMVRRSQGGAAPQTSQYDDAYQQTIAKNQSYESYILRLRMLQGPAFDEDQARWYWISQEGVDPLEEKKPGKFYQWGQDIMSGIHGALHGGRPIRSPVVDPWQNPTQ